MTNQEGKKEEFLYPEFQFLAEKHPDLYANFMALGRYPVVSGKHLDIKTKLLIPMVILAHRGQLQGVTTHIRRAFHLGILTEDEIMEAFLVSLIPGGAPTMMTGLRALMDVKKERSGPEESA